MARPMQITTRNARFQQWQALLSNRAKRHRAARFLVHGVRPITLAISHGWTVVELLHDRSRSLSAWARGTIDALPGTTHFAVDGSLLRELGEKNDETPELVAVVAMPRDDLETVRAGSGIGVVFDRPASPGNIGTLIRSADAFGAAYVLITGHAADPFDPKAIRASAGSIFAIPVVCASSHREVLSWLPDGVQVVATDETGSIDVADADLTRPTLLLIGNETAGLSTAWRESATVTVRIPMTGAASSLNAASAATVTLYEAARQSRASSAAHAADDALSRHARLA
jgi:23S rRNA (uridine2479-2'-O)-methyltransferase